jgi:hypothetical protein
LPELVCIECGATSEDGVGWRGVDATDVEEVDEPQVGIYCPESWEREFWQPDE